MAGIGKTMLAARWGTVSREMLIYALAHGVVWPVNIMQQRIMNVW